MSQPPVRDNCVLPLQDCRSTAALFAFCNVRGGEHVMFHSDVPTSVGTCSTWSQHHAYCWRCAVQTLEQDALRLAPNTDFLVYFMHWATMGGATFRSFSPCHAWLCEFYVFSEEHD